MGSSEPPITGGRTIYYLGFHGESQASLRAVPSVEVLGFSPMALEASGNHPRYPQAPKTLDPQTQRT